MVIHPLKTWPPEFKAVASGVKTFEIRKKDRPFQVGDHLELIEYNPQIQKPTGAWVEVEITYITEGPAWGLPVDMVVMAIKLGPSTGAFWPQVKRDPNG